MSLNLDSCSPDTSCAVYMCPRGCAILGFGSVTVHLPPDDVDNLREMLATFRPGSPSWARRASWRGSELPCQVRTRECGCIDVQVGFVAAHLAPGRFRDLQESLARAAAMRGAVPAGALCN